jgi:ketosteroid isomerase-like protein
MTTTEQTRAVVTEYVRTLGAGDVTALRAAFTPDAVWTLQGDLPASGSYVGPDAIFDKFLTAVMDRLDRAVPVQLELRRIVADGEWGVAEWTSVGRSRAGRTYRNDNALVFHVVDGLITEVTEYTDTERMRALFTD